MQTSVPHKLWPGIYPCLPPAAAQCPPQTVINWGPVPNSNLNSPTNCGLVSTSAHQHLQLSSYICLPPAVAKCLHLTIINWGPVPSSVPHQLWLSAFLCPLPAVVQCLPLSFLSAKHLLISSTTSTSTKTPMNASKR